MARAILIKYLKGGLGIGTGISAAALVIIVEAGLTTPVFPFMPNYALLLISIVLIMSGILNFNAAAKRKKRAQ